MYPGEQKTSFGGIPKSSENPSILDQLVDNLIASYEKICDKYEELMRLHDIDEDVISTISDEITEWSADDEYWKDPLGLGIE